MSSRTISRFGTEIVLTGATPGYSPSSTSAST